MVSHFQVIKLIDPYQFWIRQREEEKRRRKEEKQAAKRLSQYDRDRREQEESQFRGARQQDAYSNASRQQELARKRSFNAGAVGGGGAAYPTSPGAGTYASSRSDGGYSVADSIAGRFGDLGIQDGVYDKDRRVPSYSSSTGSTGIGRPRKYSVGESDKRRSGIYGDAAYPPASGYPTAPTSAYPSSPNMRGADAFGGGAPNSVYSSAYPPADPYPRAASPYARSTSPYPTGPVTSPYMPSGTLGGSGPVYPRGHILEGQPIRSRAPSPVGGAPGAYPGASPAFPQPGVPGVGGYPGSVGGPSPNMSGVPLPGTGYPPVPQEQLPAPEGFSRPINAAQPYTPFETMKILDMDEFLDNYIPKMPPVLQPVSVLSILSFGLQG